MISSTRSVDYLAVTFESDNGYVGVVVAEAWSARRLCRVVDQDRVRVPGVGGTDRERMGWRPIERHAENEWSAVRLRVEP